VRCSRAAQANSRLGEVLHANAMVGVGEVDETRLELPGAHELRQKIGGVLGVRHVAHLDDAPPNTLLQNQITAKRVTDAARTARLSRDEQVGLVVGAEEVGARRRMSEDDHVIAPDIDVLGPAVRSHALLLVARRQRQSRSSWLLLGPREKAGTERGESDAVDAQDLPRRNVAT
jgi:hypothetical protein